MSNVMIFLDNNSYLCCVESSETKEIKEVTGPSKVALLLSARDHEGEPRVDSEYHIRSLLEVMNKVKAKLNLSGILNSRRRRRLIEFKEISSMRVVKKFKFRKCFTCHGNKFVTSTSFIGGANV